MKSNISELVYENHMKKPNVILNSMKNLSHYHDFLINLQTKHMKQNLNLLSSKEGLLRYKLLKGFVEKPHSKRFDKIDSCK